MDKIKAVKSSPLLSMSCITYYGIWLPGLDVIHVLWTPMRDVFLSIQNVLADWADCPNELGVFLAFGHYTYLVLYLTLGSHFLIFQQKKPFKKFKGISISIWVLVIKNL